MLFRTTPFNRTQLPKSSQGNGNRKWTYPSPVGSKMFAGEQGLRDRFSRHCTGEVIMDLHGPLDLGAHVRRVDI